MDKNTGIKATLAITHMILEGFLPPIAVWIAATAAVGPESGLHEIIVFSSMIIFVLTLAQFSMLWENNALPKDTRGLLLLVLEPIVFGLVTFFMTPLSLQSVIISTLVITLAARTIGHSFAVFASPLFVKNKTKKDIQTFIWNAGIPVLLLEIPLWFTTYLSIMYVVRTEQLIPIDGWVEILTIILFIGFLIGRSIQFGIKIKPSDFYYYALSQKAE